MCVPILTTAEAGDTAAPMLVASVTVVFVAEFSLGVVPGGPVGVIRCARTWDVSDLL